MFEKFNKAVAFILILVVTIIVIFNLSMIVENSDFLKSLPLLDYSNDSNLTTHERKEIIEIMKSRQRKISNVCEKYSDLKILKSPKRYLKRMR